MTERTCSVGGCQRKHYGRGWCATHYKRWRRTGDPLGLRALTYNPLAACSVDGCDFTCIARGWCAMHYQRWLRHGDPLKALSNRKRWTSTTSALAAATDHPRGERPLAPATISCLVCDGVVADMGGASVATQKITRASRTMLARHRAHVDDPAWHIARAEWWARELATLQAEVEQPRIEPIQ